MIAYCTFRTNHTHYAIESDKIRVVLAEFNISRIPTKNPYVVGIMNVYGDIYSVIQLTEKDYQTHKYCIVVKDFSFAILCESVELVEASLLEQLTDSHRNFVTSYIASFPTERTYVIGLEELIRDIEQYNEDRREL